MLYSPKYISGSTFEGHPLFVYTIPFSQYWGF